MPTRMTAPKMPVCVSIPRRRNWPANSQVTEPAVTRRATILTVWSRGRRRRGYGGRIHSGRDFALVACQSLHVEGISRKSKPYTGGRAAPAATRRTRDEREPSGFPLISLVDLGAEVRLRLDERVDVAEAVIAVLHELGRRLLQQRSHQAVQRFVEGGRRSVIVRAGAAFRLRDHFLDHAHPDDLARCELQLLGSLHLARVVPPDDRCRRLG